MLIFLPDGRSGLYIEHQEIITIRDAHQDYDLPSDVSRTEIRHIGGFEYVEVPVDEVVKLYSFAQQIRLGCRLLPNTFLGFLSLDDLQED
jgi:hypothetical protein